MSSKNFILILSSFLSVAVFGQVKPADEDSSVFSKWVNILRSRKELNFFGIGPWKVNGEGTEPLLFETQIRQDFLLYRGRSNQRPLAKSLLLNFDLGLNIRMYQGADYPSYPIRPLSFIPGLSLHYLINHVRFATNRYAFLNNTKLKNFYTAKLSIAHYSNGQSGSFYNFDSTNTNRENGNFSTNFLKTEFSWSRFFNDHLLSAALHYQREFGIGEVLAMDKGLSKSYGRDRLGLGVIFHSANFRLGQYKYKNIFYQLVDSAGSGRRMLAVTTSKKYNRYFNLKARYDWGYIIDNVSFYPTQKNPSSSANRSSHRFSISLYPANSRTLGFFSSIYYGRDYYNICYPDKILNFKAGLVFDLNKYIPPGTVYMKTE